MANEDFANLVAFIQDENDRKNAVALLEKYEPLRAGYLRQQDYDRNMNDWKGRVAEADQKIKDWSEWYARNSTIYETTVQENEKLKLENEDLKGKAQVASSQLTNQPPNGNPATGIDQKQLQALVEERLQGKGYMSQADVLKIAREEASKLADAERSKFFKETFPATVEFNATLTEIQLAHRDEFGKPLDRKAFGEFMTKSQIGDPNKAYDQFVNEARTAKKIKEEVDRQVKDELSKHNVPGTGSTPAPQELGPMQQRMQKQNLPEILFDESIRPGDGRLAAAAAAELAAEGKA